MNCLAIDTSSDYLSLALSHGDQLYEHHEPAGQAQAEHALPAVRGLLTQAGINLGSLDCVIYGQGPGSFTGLRIACGLAQGLAFAANLPVMAIPTLDCIAAQASGHVLVCLDARMHQVYTAAYDTENWQILSPITLSNPDAVTLPDAVGHWTGAGNGFTSYGSEFSRQLMDNLAETQPDLRPYARFLIKLASSGRYQLAHPRDAGLLYIRDKVALTTSEQQAQHK
jgi:tRNA threonylcarbamoyladenosine biosynthesis protein TsaB